jgi:hypothetical protein
MRFLVGLWADTTGYAGTKGEELQQEKGMRRGKKKERE